MLEVTGLTKYYGDYCALNSVSFEVPAGSVTGVAGANGAGKSTLFDILTTLDRRYTGCVNVGGLDVKNDYRQIRKRIGYVPGVFSLYPYLTVKENIDFYAGIYGSGTKYLVHSQFWDSLKEFADYRTDQLSGGMKQKLSIICAMIHAPTFLFLDEPTTGIDSDSRAAIWEELADLKNKGVTVFVSTHYYEEFNHMDNLLFLHEGNQLFYRSLTEIKEGGNDSAVFFEDYLSGCLENGKGM